MALNAFAAAVFAASAFSLTVFFTVSQALEAVSLIVLHAVPSASFIPSAILDTVSLAAVSLSEINPFTASSAPDTTLLILSQAAIRTSLQFSQMKRNGRVII